MGEKTIEDEETWRDLARSAAVTTLVCGSVLLTGIAWAVAGWALGHAADGVAPEDYDAGSRFAATLALLWLLVAVPAATLVGYLVSRAYFRRTSAFVTAQLIGGTGALAGAALLAATSNT